MRWHYTVGERLKAILQDGFIKPATANVPPGERPIVWFTVSPDWEETANKGWIDSKAGRYITLTREETEKRGGGLFRIGVADDFPLEPFLRISRKSRQGHGVTNALIRTAVEAGSNPYRDWWGTFKPVSCFDWSALEIRTPDGWRQFIDLQEILKPKA